MSTETYIDRSIFRRYPDRLPDHEWEKLRELEKKSDEHMAKLEETPSSAPNFHKVLRKQYKIHEEVTDFKTYLDANFPEWREERPDL